MYQSPGDTVLLVGHVNNHGLRVNLLKNFYLSGWSVGIRLKKGGIWRECENEAKEAPHD